MLHAHYFQYCSNYIAVVFGQGLVKQMFVQYTEGPLAVCVSGQ